MMNTITNHISASFSGNVRRIFFAALTLCALTASSSGQQVDVVARLRLAQSFEQTGEWDRAATLYESLLESSPQNFVVLEGLRRAYTELKQYDKAMDLVRRQLLGNPADPAFLIQH